MRRATPLLLVLLAGLAVARPAEARRVAYVVNQGTATVSAFALAADGSAAALGNPVPTGGASPSFIALTPDGRYAYVTNVGPDTVSAFDVAADGTLSAIGPPVAAGGIDPTGIAVAPDGSRVYVANLTSNTISAFAVGADGRLSSIGAPTPSGGISTRQVAVTPDGRFVWAVASSTSTVRPFAVQADGSLAAAGDPLDPVGSDLFDVAFSPDGARAYGVNFGTPDVNPFTVGADGRPAESGTPVGHGGDMPRTIAVAPDGRRVFTANTNSADVSLLTVGDGGALTLSGAPVAAGGAPFGVAVAPSGRFAYAADQNGNLLAFAAPGGGALSVLGAPVATGGGSPRGIAIAPNQGPVAAFASTAGRAGRPTSFDGTGSTDPDGVVATHAWDFGDGTTASGAQPSHVYARPGTYTVALTVVDDEGCSTFRVFTGKTAHCNGGSAARTAAAVTVPPRTDRTRPVVTSFKARPSAFRIGRRPTAKVAARRRGTKFRFRLSEAARVTIRLHRLRAGRRVGGRCRAATRERRARRPCVRAVATGRLVRSRKAGRASVRFSGRVGRRALPAGRFRAAITARDKSGNFSKRRTTRFSVVRR